MATSNSPGGSQSTEPKRGDLSIVALEADGSAPDPDVLLINAEVDDLLEQVSCDRESLLLFLGNEKNKESKIRLRDLINSFSDSILKIASPYNLKNERDAATSVCNSALEKACSHLERATASLISAAQPAPMPVGASFASVVARAPRQTPVPGKVALSPGTLFTVKPLKRVVIGPAVGREAQYSSSKDTKAALLKAIDPAKLKIRVQRVSYGPDCSVLVEGDSLDIYLYPARDKTSRSCVLEVKPAVRAYLRKRNRLNIGWISCRFDDHVSITQCFKCCQLGHIAKNCNNAVRCSKCPGEH